MAGEYAVPLLLVALIVLAIASWRVIHPPLALALTLVTGTSTAAYLFLSVIPRFLAASQSVDVAAAPFQAMARDARSRDMAIQVYRGAELLGECALAGPGDVPVRPSEPLRLERRAGGSGFQVWSGATLIGDLPESALATFQVPGVQPESEKPSRRASSEPPSFFITGKIAVGGTFSLGPLPPVGAVTLQFVRLNQRGLAVVKLSAPELGPAQPDVLELSNKSALTQSFERMEFDVAIREASFIADPPWAAFAVMAHR